MIDKNRIMTEYIGVWTTQNLGNVMTKKIKKNDALTDHLMQDFLVQ